jgi:hypothetical protein
MFRGRLIVSVCISVYSSSIYFCTLIVLYSNSWPLAHYINTWNPTYYRERLPPNPSNLSTIDIHISTINLDSKNIQFNGRKTRVTRHKHHHA